MTIRFGMKYKYNKNRLPTMEKGVVKAIGTVRPTNNEKNKDLCVSDEPDDTRGGGDGDKGP